MGVICYTFAADTDLIARAIHTIESIISGVAYFLFNVLGSGILGKLPEKIKNTFGFCKSLIFYIFLYYIISWV